MLILFRLVSDTFEWTVLFSCLSRQYRALMSNGACSATCRDQMKRGVREQDPFQTNCMRDPSQSEIQPEVTTSTTIWTTVKGHLLGYLQKEWEERVPGKCAFLPTLLRILEFT